MAHQSGRGFVDVGFLPWRNEAIGHEKGAVGFQRWRWFGVEGFLVREERRSGMVWPELVAGMMVRDGFLASFSVFLAL